MGAWRVVVEDRNPGGRTEKSPHRGVKISAQQNRQVPVRKCNVKCNQTINGKTLIKLNKACRDLNGIFEILVSRRTDTYY